LAATGAVVLLGIALAGLYWLVVGSPPTIAIIIGAAIGLAMGIPLLALTSPRRHR
ncbi:MAG: hypothetical protein JOY61_09565, partial [Chloroflexi bacterium]|nr:hypothetical protein [Chloroflexota bacterium]